MDGLPADLGGRPIRLEAGQLRSERSARVKRSEAGPVRAEAAAALIFDPEASAFVWANAAGLALFGVKSIARLSQDRLDRALPAASRLIAFAANEDEALAEMALDFWTPRGPVRIEAVVERLVLSRERVGVLIRAGGVAIDRRRAETILKSVPPAPPPELKAVESVETEPPLTGFPEIEARCRHSLEISQEDAETLREIARMIRQGEASPLPDVSSIDPYLADEPYEAHSEQALCAPLEMREERALPAPGGTKAATAPASPATSAQDIPSLDFASDAMRLIAEVAHELRTPLTAVRGYGELIAGRPQDTQVAERAGHIVRAADHALALITDILDARLLSTGKSELVFTDVDLSHELVETAAMLAPQARATDVAIEVAPKEAVPKVVADARRVRQVLLNVTGNAIKFTSARGSVRLSTHYTAEGAVEVLVSDTGRGMAASEAAAHLGTPAARNRGGIGLPLSRALAEANGARLLIESHPGAGTTVRLVFPPSCVVPP